MNVNKIGKFILELRKEKGWTQQELANKIFVTDKAVSKWERGLSLPDIELLIPISKLFDVSVLELLKGEKIINEKEKKEFNEDEIVIETLKSSKNTFNKFKIPKLLKIIMIIIFSWSIIFSTDYIFVSKLYRSPLFSITTKSENITDEHANYIEKEYKGLGYSIITKGQIVNNKYSIDYGKINIMNINIKTFFKGVCE